MQRMNIFSNPTAGESLNIPQFNTSLGTLALRNSEVYTNQINYLQTGDVLRMPVGKLAYITMFTYAYASSQTLSFPGSINTIDDFTITSALNGADVRGVAYTMPSGSSGDRVDDMDPSSSDNMAYLQYQWLTYTINPSATNEVDYYDITIGNIGGTSGHTVKKSSNGVFTQRSQKTFFILHTDDYKASYAQLVGDLYQGNEAILGSVRDHFNKNVSAPIIGRQSSYFMLSKDLFPTQDNYGLLSTFLGKGLSSSLYEGEGVFSRQQHVDNSDIAQYAFSAEETTKKFLDIGSEDSAMYLGLPSRFNLYPLSMQAILNEKFYVGKILDSALTYGDKDLLTSFEVNLVNESAGLKYYNLNLNKYLSKGGHMLIPNSDEVIPSFPTFQACNYVSKYAKIGMFTFSNVSEGGISISVTGLKVDYAKAW